MEDPIQTLKIRKSEKDLICMGLLKLAKSYKDDNEVCRTIKNAIEELFIKIYYGDNKNGN